MELHVREDGHDRTVEHITGWEGGNPGREAPTVRCWVPGREEGGAGPASCAQGPTRLYREWHVTRGWRD